MTSAVKEKQTVKKTYHNWNVILHNDDVNDIRHVVESLCVVVGIDFEKAKGHAIEAHETGKSIVKSCNKEHAEFYKQGLTDKGLTATMEQA